MGSWDDAKDGPLTLRSLDVRRLLIHCADAREEANLAEKIAKKLLWSGEKPATISLYGGPVCLAHPDKLPAQFKCMLEQIRFHLKNFGTEIVLVGHDCGFYNVIPLSATEDMKKADLVCALRNLQGMFPGAKISAYYDVSDDNEISFEKVAHDDSLASA